MSPWADWAELAEQDYRVAERLLSDADLLFFRSVGFHSQQSAEKYLKALLVFKNVAFPKTHDITLLLQLVADNGGLPTGLEIDTGSPLNRYGVGVRYPDDMEPVDLDEARQAFNTAAAIRDIIKPLLSLSV